MSRTRDSLIVLLILLLLLMAMVLQCYTIYYGDKQWEMLYAQMWVGGKALYRDIVPVSPPLIFWIYGLVAKLSFLSGLPDGFLLLGIFGNVSVVLSIFLSTRLIAQHPAFAGNRRRQAEFAILLAFLFLFRTSSIYFIDREHLFFILTFPYLILFLPGLDDKNFTPWQRVALAFMAAIGFSIKPYCLVVWFGIQFLYCLRRRSLRPLICMENLIITAGGICYLLLVAWLTPDYFSRVLPMALLTYSATREVKPAFFYSGNALSILVPTLLMFRLRQDSPYRKDIWYLLALCPVYYAYALLNNNWSYTYYPLSTIALFVTGYALWEFFYLKEKNTAQSLPTGACKTGIVLCMLTFAVRFALSLDSFYHVGIDPCHLNSHCRGDDTVLAELVTDKGSRSFGTISIDFDRWTRLVFYSHADWVTRFPQLWMLPRFFLDDHDAFARDHRWVLDYIAESYADDLDNYKPDVLFVDDADDYYTAVRNVNLVGFFSANPRFREAMQHYRPLHRIDLCGPPPPDHRPYKIECSYRVYRRKDL